MDKEKRERDKFMEELAAETQEDFEARRNARLAYERQWELNMNFLRGNQYCGIGARGEITEGAEGYYWQQRGVFNHIAPLMESRMARFSRISPVLSVRPRTDDEAEISGAKAAEKALISAFERADINEVVRKATVWSETCGSGFYKVLWREDGGEKVGEADGESVYEGEVSITAVSPFEIFPDNLFAEKVEDCFSIIQARAMPVREIKRVYGQVVPGEKVDVYSLSPASGEGASVLKDAAVVIEKYEKPSETFPLGRVITVAGGKLLYYGTLPYKNGENGARTFPFIKQDSVAVAGNFFGAGIIERLIPVQRAYNAVKNRKHEFLNRLSMGVMTVEEGSVDVDDLQEEGLPPGKILVYRQGAAAPEMMRDLSMPADFNDEEDKLINEFVIISGVSDVSSSSSNARLASGSALEILMEQDNERLLLPAEEIRKSYVEIARQVIRLYAQFSAGIRQIKYTDGNNKTHITYAEGLDRCSDDVYAENENELLYSQSAKKDMIFKLYESGLLGDDSGKLRPATKEKVLSLLGYKDLDYRKGLSELQEEKAGRENEKLLKAEVLPDEVDDDAVHIDEHSRFVLSEYETLGESARARFYAHIKAHRERQKAPSAAPEQTTLQL